MSVPGVGLPLGVVVAARGVEGIRCNQAVRFPTSTGGDIRWVMNSSIYRVVGGWLQYRGKRRGSLLVTPDSAGRWWHLERYELRGRCSVCLDCDCGSMPAEEGADANR